MSLSRNAMTIATATRATPRREHSPTSIAPGTTTRNARYGSENNGSTGSLRSSDPDKSWAAPTR